MINKNETCHASIQDFAQAAQLLKTVNRWGGVYLMIADGDPGFALHWKEVLEERNLKVRSAMDAMEAVKLIKEIGPRNVQRIIIDHRLSKDTGIVLVEYLRKNHPDIPMLMVSGNEDTIKKVHKDRPSIPFENKKNESAIMRFLGIGERTC